MSKVFVFGASGFIGRKFLSSFNELECITVGRNNSDVEFDLEAYSNVNKVVESINSNDFVIFLSAISSPDECELNYSRSYKINVTNTQKIIAALLRKGVRVIFSSSDAVFGKSGFLCDEDSQLSPFGKYGEMKAEVENFFKNHKNFFIVRFSYVLAKDDKFSSMVLEHAKSGKNLDVFDGFERNVISIEDVLLGLKNIIKHWDDIRTRVVNFSANELVSRQDIVTELASNSYPNLVYSFTDAPDCFWKNRPKVIYTKSNFLESILEQPIKSYKECIKEYNQQ